MGQKYRLVTRNDIDGLMCGALLNELEMIDDILFTHPAEMQKGNVKISNNDIIANLPYHENAHLVFDHHESERLRITTVKHNFILDTEAKSVSRVIFNHFGASDKFKKITWQIIKQIDNVKGSGISYNDIMNPKDWVLLSIIIDSRTGLERFVGSELANDKTDLSIDFIDRIADEGIAGFLQQRDVQERIGLLKKYDKEFKEQIERCSTLVNKKILLLDKRKEEIIYPGNRFYVFTSTEEEIDYLIHIIKGFNSDEVTIAVRQSPLSMKKNMNIGNLLYKFNGGGNDISGSCQIKEEDIEKTLEELYKILT